MKTTIKVTNEEIFNSKVVDVDTSDLIGLNGTLAIETTEGVKEITGEHGEKDYEREFGFVLVVEI